MIYILVFLTGWIGSIIIGMILSTIFKANKSTSGGFIAGILNPIIAFYIISKLLLDENQDGTYQIAYIIVMALPLFLINIQALYNSKIQDKNESDKLPSTGFRMKINKGLAIGTLIGCLFSVIILSTLRI
jgi:uncharacterized sodium:solute symporter family permease YidK